MVMTTKLKPNYPDGRGEKSKDRSKHTQMWWFCALFSSITLACGIVSSCQTIVRSIRDIILKLCAICVNQYAKKSPTWLHNQSWILYQDHTHRTWPPANFSCSQNWKNPWKGGVLPQSLNQFNGYISNASRIGESADTMVLCLRRIPLKGLKYIFRKV